MHSHRKHFQNLKSHITHTILYGRNGLSGTALKFSRSHKTYISFLTLTVSFIIHVVPELHIHIFYLQILFILY